MHKVLVGGSIAYDHIMDFPGLFKDHILPDKIESLNVSFLVNSLKKIRGGTAPNIAYNLALIGEKPMIVGTAGKDFCEYKEWLEARGVDTRYIRILEHDFTASCFINTDLSNNQITSFYPGAMARDPEISLKALDLSEISMVVIAPTEPKAMVRWVDECQKLDIPYLYDPGMQIPRLAPGDLLKGVQGARIVVSNEYEFEMLYEKTGLKMEDILNGADLCVKTLGSQGCLLRTRRESVHVPAAKPARVVDPTGAGDAFRAGLLKGYFEGASLETMGRYANIAAVYAVEHKGAVEHSYTCDQFMKRYRENFEK
ncbi:MAG: carbohydrate kinase family protein [Clostridiales bacterium]|jgi:adenosine kinase|nr:carbohydrate kinase family protein [Eubacteriales bacterium]MDH7565802.1 carbohydrate kinase family protein [Clostridiales bacterium]